MSREVEALTFLFFFAQRWDTSDRSGNVFFLHWVNVGIINGESREMLSTSGRLGALYRTRVLSRFFTPSLDLWSFCMLLKQFITFLFTILIFIFVKFFKTLFLFWIRISDIIEIWSDEHPMRVWKSIWKMIYLPSFEYQPDQWFFDLILPFLIIVRR